MNDDEGKRGWGIDGVQWMLYTWVTQRLLPLSALAVALAVMAWALFF